MRKSDIEQLSLFQEGPQTTWVEAPQLAAGQSEALPPASAQEDLDLTSYCRETLATGGPHDAARREWLRNYAIERSYQASAYTIHGRMSGYYRVRVPEGEKAWQNFLSGATQFDIYCCFIQVFAPHPLSHYLEDAVKRGEMSPWQLENKLLWRPGASTKRGGPHA